MAIIELNFPRPRVGARTSPPVTAALLGLGALFAAGCGSGGPERSALEEAVASTSARDTAVADLSNIGQGDFDIAFQVQTTQSTGSVGVLGQRGACTGGDFWDIRLVGGQVFVETDDGASYTPLQSTANVADGALHSVEVQRSSGTLTILVDGAATASAVSPASFGALSRPATGNYGCVNRDGTVPLSGTLASPSLDGVGLFTSDLSNVGQGNFTVSFQLATVQNSGSVGVLGQRSVCSHGDFWDIRLEDGQVLVETDDGTNYTPLQSTAMVADGALHTVVVQRMSETLTIAIDGHLSWSAPSLSSLGALAPVSAGAYGCANGDGTVPLAGELVAIPGTATETAPLPVLPGAINVTAGQIPTSYDEEETAIDTLGDKAVIAFNKVDNVHYNHTQLCSGLDQVGFAYASTENLDSWTVNTLPLPSNTAAIIGDPGVVGGFSNGATLSFFISALATSSDRWNALKPDANGCTSPTNYSQFLTNQVCVWRYDFTQGSNGAPVPAGSYCVGPSGSTVEIDGTNITSDGSSIYVAYQNLNAKSAQVFKDQTLLPALPFANVSDHALFVKGGTNNGSVGITVVAPDASGNVNGTWFKSGAWISPVRIATAQTDSTPVAGGLRGIGYAAAWNFPPSEPQLILFFQTASGGKTVLQGARCGGDTTGITHCSEPSGWVTASNANSFMPSLATAIVPQPRPNPFPNVDTWLSYWSDSGRGDSSVGMKLAFVGTTALSIQDADGSTTQVPCPLSSSIGGYWGDYDESVFINNRTTGARLLRPFSDSSVGCDGQGNTTHVSVFSLGVQ